MRLPFRHARVRHRLGFSLVELSVVIAIIGVVAAFGLEASAIFVNRSAGNTTKERLVALDEAISRFYSIYGRLPCPAVISQAPTHASYGLEDCTISVWTVDAEYTDLIGGGLMSGAVPFRTLNLPRFYAIDGFYNKINYVVTKNLTVAGTGSDTFGYFDGTDATTLSHSGVGGIEIRSGVLEQPCNTSKCQILALPTPAAYPATTGTYGAAYVLFSNGADGRGAYSVQGTAQLSCVPSPTSSFSSRVDTQNCQRGTSAGAHTTSVSGIPKNVFYDNRFNNGLNLVSYFDDYVIWRAKSQL